MLSKHPLKWGIIGAGIIAEHFCDAVRHVDNCITAAVASKSRERAEAFASKNDVPKSCTYDEIVSDDSIDVIYVATTHNFHYENVKLALEHDKAVLVEKPFMVNAAQAEEIVDLARQRNLFLMEAMWNRFLPSHVLLRRLIAEGRIGEVRQITVHFGNVALPKYAGRLFDPALAGGVTLDMGCYPISFISALLTEFPSEIQSICRFSASGVDELADYSFRYPSSAIAQVCTSFNLVMKGQAYIYGNKGFIEYPEPQFGKSFSLYRHEGRNELPEPEIFRSEHHENGFVYQIREVHRCLEAGLTGSPLMRPEDSTAIMRILDRIRAEIGLKYTIE